MLPYKIIESKSNAVPLLLSIPHCGTAFPDELKAQYKQKLIAAPDDTDWYVDDLYSFASDIGINIITSVYSRWVIDLNRDPESKPLYTDGRIITGLCPTTTFLGEPLYHDERTTVSQHDVDDRLQKYYVPYHAKVAEELQKLKSKFGKVLLWDCHSIRQSVPTIHASKFPDLILGSADETSASQELIDVALKNLGSDNYHLSHNYPFKGGYITRHFGKPSENQHALQLEMSKVNYMDDSEMKYDKVRAGRMQETLKRTLSTLIQKLI